MTSDEMRAAAAALKKFDKWLLSAMKEKKSELAIAKANGISDWIQLYELKSEIALIQYIRRELKKDITALSHTP